MYLEERNDLGLLRLTLMKYGYGVLATSHVDLLKIELYFWGLRHFTPGHFSSRTCFPRLMKGTLLNRSWTDKRIFIK